MLFFSVSVLLAQYDASHPDKSPVEEGKNEKSLNVNIDAALLYGQYNSINSDFSVTQDFENFSYQLNSDFKRSNDYGYSNTSFFENKIGFTGMADLTESWKFIPTLEVENDSHGMYSNPVYSREENDHIVIRFKNEYTPTPARWNINVGGANYVHRLISAGLGDVDNQSYFKAEGQIGWEYGWSAAVLVKVASKFAHYDYNTTSDNDTYVANDLIGSFKMTEYILITLGPTYSWNRDATHFGGGKISVSSVNLKNFTLEAGYQYDLKPFEPEILYKDQKFVLPDFGLAPEKVHRAECKVGFEYRNDSESTVYVKSIKFKAVGTFEKHDGYYNFHIVYGNLITPDSIELLSARGKGEINMEMQMGKENSLRVGASYEYNYFYCDSNITYKPVYIAAASIKFQIFRFGIDWNNSLMGSVFIDPESDTKLDRALIGSVSVYYKILDSFYLYGKVDNIYDTRYHYRFGYPEPGRLFLGGLRIQI